MRGMPLSDTPLTAEDFGEAMTPERRNALVASNMRIVYQVVALYSSRGEYEDLVQAGTLGLITAIERFDRAKGSFYSYAKLHIINEIQCACNETRGLSRRSGVDTNDALALAVSILYGRHFSTPDPVKRGPDASGERTSMAGPRYVKALLEPVYSPQDALDAYSSLKIALAAVPSDYLGPMLAYLDGVPLPDISRGLGCSQGSAIAIIEGALTIARKALEATENEASEGSK